MVSSVGVLLGGAIGRLEVRDDLVALAELRAGVGVDEEGAGRLAGESQPVCFLSRVSRMTTTWTNETNAHEGI